MLPQGFYHHHHHHLLQQQQQQQQNQQTTANAANSSLPSAAASNFASGEYSCHERSTAAVTLGHRTNPHYRALQLPSATAGQASSSSQFSSGKQDVTLSHSSDLSEVLDAAAAPYARQISSCAYFDPSTHQTTFSNHQPELHQRRQQQQQQPYDNSLRLHQPHNPLQQQWFSAEYRGGSVAQGFQPSFGGSTWMADGRPAPNQSSQFPDSPPDSGSEPYSPPNDNQGHPAEQLRPGGKVNTMNGENLMPAHLYQTNSGQVQSALQLQSGISPSNAQQQQQPQQQQQLADVLAETLQGQTHQLQGQPHSLHSQPNPLQVQPLSHQGQSSMASFGVLRPNYGHPYVSGEPPKLNHSTPAQLTMGQMNPTPASLANTANHPSKKKKVPTATLR